MTMIDYLILTALLAAALYASGRLFLGWLRTPSRESQTYETEKASRVSVDPVPTHTGSKTGAPWQLRDHERDPFA